MRNPKGLSLIEVLISLAIIGVVIVAVASSMAGNLKVSSSSNKQSLATEYVNGVLEQYRIHWKSLANYNAASTPNGLAQLNRMLPSDFSVVLAAENLDVDGSPSTLVSPPMRKITITVTRGTKPLATGTTLIGKPSN